MGVPPFLIASTLNMSVAQRLVRKLCNHCNREEPITPELLPKGFEITKELSKHHIPVGCNHCHQTGYHGRKAIYEILPINKKLAKPIKDNELEIDDYLKENNINSLKTNAINMVQQGVTSIEEVYPLLTN